MSKVELLSGNEAAARSAILSGCRFYSGYPITPSSEIAEEMSRLLPLFDGKFIQMEDEIAGIGAALGASLAGVKSMTATSGPGFSLKQEHIGFATMCEIPIVIINVMRGGPSTGMPTYPSQADIMQAKWGTHGDHEAIALCPSSVDEVFEYTMKAFNIAEELRTPVVLLIDEIVAHLNEKVEILAKSSYTLKDRIKPSVIPEKYKPFDTSFGLVPPLAPYGKGYRFHITGLAHNESGFPTTKPLIVEKLQERLRDKILDNYKKFEYYEERMVDDAEVLVVAYGSVARSAMRSIKDLRREGIKVGLFRPITIWPFNYKRLKKISKKVKHIIVPEMNLGQIINEVKLSVSNKIKVVGLNKVNGEIITPSQISTKIKEVL